MLGRPELQGSGAGAVALRGATRALDHSNGKVGAVGFCWGGAFVNRLAVAAGDGLDAGVAYYGPAPAPLEAAKVKAAMLLHYAGNDERVNKTGGPWAAALKKGGANVTAHTYPGVEHAFNKDTSAERYETSSDEH